MTTRLTMTHAHIALRCTMALLGSYFFVWGFVSLAITGLAGVGWSYLEAQTAAMLLAFIVFLLVFCVSFAVNSLARLMVVVLGGACLMTTLAGGLQASLL